MSTDGAVDSTARGRKTTPAERLRLLIQPVLVLTVGAAVDYWALRRDLTATQQANINTGNVLTLTWQHILITFAGGHRGAVGVPLGTLLTRPGAKVLPPFFVGVANIGRRRPAIGLLVLLYLLDREDRFWIGVLPIALYSLLPVLSSTILGIDQVDRSLYRRGARARACRAVRCCCSVELPLAVPYILAGLRTSLVLAVGTATLSFLVNAGGLGILIDTGYKLQDNVTLILGSVLAVCLALLVDWLGGLAEFFWGPKGLR